MRRRIGLGWVLCAVCCAAWSCAAAAVSEAEPNDALPQALGALASIKTMTVDGSSGYAGDLDWYSFEVPGAEAQTVRLAVDSAASWQIVLYTEGLVHVASDTDSLTRKLDPGTYRVRIQETDLGTESYALLVSNAVERESNDGLAEAMSLGTLESDPLVVFASIDPAGDVDFFSFDVPADFAAGVAPGSSRIIRIETPCPTGDTLVLLYAQDEDLGYPVPIARNDDSGAGSWSRLYIADPAPGRYTLRVHEYADNEQVPTYRVVVTPLTVSSTEPNDTAARATPLGEIAASGRLETTQFIAAGDVDAFSFTVSSPLCLLAETSGASLGDSVISLLDADGNEIARDDDGGAGTWSRLFRKLNPGSYAVTVRALDETREFDYTLTLTAPACPSESVESEPNDTVASANRVNVPVDVSAELAPGNVDVYRFTLSAPATVNAETYGAADGDTTICLLDSDGQTILCDDDGGAGLWSLAQAELEPGTYFVRVELYAGTDPVAYHLLVQTRE
jgi:hypothetical protein